MQVQRFLSFFESNTFKMRLLFHFCRVSSNRILQCNSIVKLLEIANFSSKSTRFKSQASVLKTLKYYGIKKEDLYSHPKLLSMPKNELTEKTEYLSNKVIDKENVLSLLALPLKDIAKYFDIKINDYKIQGLSSILKCSEIEARHLFVKHAFLLRSKISTVKDKVDIMLEGGVSLEDVRRDLWILTYTREHIKSRIEAIKKLDIKPIRPWMLRREQHLLYRAKSNKADNLMAMAPYENQSQYICNRLGLTPAEFDSFVSKCPLVAKVQVSKLKELIDFLLFEGFTTHQISQTPRVLCHSIHTIKDRLGALKENNYTPPTLAILCKNKKKFESFVSKLSKEAKQES